MDRYSTCQGKTNFLNFINVATGQGGMYGSAATCQGHAGAGQERSLAIL